MKRRRIVAVAAVSIAGYTLLATVFIICRNAFLQPPPVVVVEPKREAVAEPAESEPPQLTAEVAQAALQALLKSPEAGELKEIPERCFVGAALKVDEEHGEAQWGPFQLGLDGKWYTYTLAYGSPPRVCTWFYRGEFRMRDGRWVALPPKVTSQALGGF